MRANAAVYRCPRAFFQMATGLSLVALAAGCVGSDQIPCSWGVSCPAGQVCHEPTQTCELPEAIDACRDVAEHASCHYLGAPGDTICRQGVCISPRCGDGFVDPDEACDDGNAVGGDGCSADCLSDETCGNGVVDPGEGCDGGSLNSDTAPDACRTSCQPAGCGDGVVDTGEACDGSNLGGLTCTDFGYVLAVGLSCSASCSLDPSGCTAVCGNAMVEPGEGCDDGDGEDGDGCSAQCTEELHWHCSGSPSQCECVGFFYGTGCDQCVVLVDRDPTITQRDGLSWPTAFATVQEGIDAAHGIGSGCEVWVAAGTYFIYVSAPADTLTLRPGVALYGGFAGGETERGQRDWEANETVLDGANSAGTAHVYHVVTGSDDATMDGFSITGGEANGSTPDNQGGGMYNDQSAPVVRNCIFTGNSARSGGGMANLQSSPALADCIFFGNSAQDYGGGTYNNQSSPVVSGCVFSGNSADCSGGGMHNDQSSPMVSGCVFSDNSALLDGGGMANYVLSSPVVSGCVFAGNSARSGGGMANLSSSPVVSGCTFAGNTADHGGGMANFIYSSSAVSRCAFAGNTSADLGGGIYNSGSSPVVSGCTLTGNSADHGGGMANETDSSPTVSNCIIQGNEASDGTAIFDDSSAPQVAHSDVQGGYPGGTAILDVDPGFASAPLDTGPWDAVTYDAALLQTALHDPGASWSPDALMGLFVQPETDDPRWYPVVANTAQTIRVWGDVEGVVTAGDTYALHDLHLGSGSPCIDAGYGCSTLGGCTIPPWVPETSAVDIDGDARYDAGLSGTNGGAGNPSYVDLGADEYVP